MRAVLHVEGILELYCKHLEAFLGDGLACWAETVGVTATVVGSNVPIKRGREEKRELGRKAGQKARIRVKR